MRVLALCFLQFIWVPSNVQASAEDDNCFRMPNLDHLRDRLTLQKARLGSVVSSYFQLRFCIHLTALLDKE